MFQNLFLLRKLLSNTGVDTITVDIIINRVSCDYTIGRLRAGVFVLVWGVGISTIVTVKCLATDAWQ